jgi:hypothetical protein
VVRTFLTYTLLLAATSVGAAAQSSSIEVSATVLEPMALRTGADVAVTYRRGEHVEISTPVQVTGSGAQIVTVQATSDGEGRMARGAELRVRTVAGGSGGLGGASVRLGRSGGRVPEEGALRYRVDVPGADGGRDIKLSVRYVVSSNT